MDRVSKRGWVLVTGGCGYVAGTVVRALLGRGFEVVVYDNLSTGYAESLPPEAHLVVGDVRDTVTLRALLQDASRVKNLVGTFHFAARIEVAESVKDPIRYYDVNVGGSTSLLQVLSEAAPGTPVVFSSSAGVYGNPGTTPIPEGATLQPMSPYGETKQVVEHLLADLHRAAGLPYMALRYFNAAGACEGVSERHAPESHLLPNLLTAAANASPVSLFGTDYPTPDGTAIRDYIHVSDLARGHLLALEVLADGGESESLNLGSGQGTSIREALSAAEAVVGHPIAHTFGPRRPGDPPILVADISRAHQVLGFAPERSGIEVILADAWAYGNFR